jgi:uncharacterized membrane protein
MLRFGVTLAAVVVLAGGVQMFLHPLPLPDYTHFKAASPSLCTPGGILAGARKLDSASLIQLGLLLLIATPVARVIFCVAGFARQRDWLYVAISTSVLAILAYSLTQGAR